MNNEQQNILVTGSGGQLGMELQQLAVFFPDYKFIFADHHTLPIDNKELVDQFFSANEIDHCINAAAYTAVDKAEDEYQLAVKINGTAVGFLADAAFRHNASFIHISTDYVFDGNGDQPYQETDPVNPVNAYGRSKLEGENAAAEFHKHAIVIRTSWLYSSFGKNFVKTMLRLMESKSEISVVQDQQGSPTYAADLAEVIMQIIASGKALTNGGVYQFSNEGIISWFDFATEIKNLSGSSCIVNPIPTTAYPTPAARPKYSALDNRKLQTTFGLKGKQWQESLQSCLKLIS